MLNQSEAARLVIACRAEVDKAELRTFAAETKATLASMRVAHLERKLNQFDVSGVELPKETWKRRR